MGVWPFARKLDSHIGQSSSSLRGSENKIKEAKGLSLEKWEGEQRHPPPKGWEVTHCHYLAPLVVKLFVNTKGPAERPGEQD